MLTSGLIARAGAALAAGGLVFGLSAIPAGSQVVPGSSVTLTGSAECQLTGGENGGPIWVISYNLHNNIDPQVIVGSAPAAFGDVDVTSAFVSLNGTTLAPAVFSPNPVPAAGDATTSGELPGDTVGTFTMSLDWDAATVPDSGTATLDLLLDSSCGGPVSTTTSTTQAPAVQAEAVAVSPAFTG